MKLYWFVSQGMAIYATRSKDEAIETVKHENEDNMEYIERCIEECEHYADTSITLYEVELNAGDRFNLYDETYTIDNIFGSCDSGVVIYATKVSMYCRDIRAIFTMEQDAFLHIYPVDDSKVKEITP